MMRQGQWSTGVLVSRASATWRWTGSGSSVTMIPRRMSSNQTTPDFNTSVNVAEHRCSASVPSFGMGWRVQTGDRAKGAPPPTIVETDCTHGDVCSISLRKARVKKIIELKDSTRHSLVAESIKHVEEDEEHMLTADALRKLGQAQLTKQERIKRRRALDTLGVPTFDEFLAQQKLALNKGAIEILQMNIGLYCNQVRS